MTKQAGIWIDKSKAIIIYLVGNTSTLKEVKSTVETKVRFEGETKQFGRFGQQFLSHKEKQDLRETRQKKEFLHVLMSQLERVDEMVVLGPAEMKIKLQKLILQDHKMRHKLKGVESSDSITNNQLIAWVKKYFEQ